MFIYIRYVIDFHLTTCMIVTKFDPAIFNARDPPDCRMRDNIHTRVYH